MCEHVVVYEPVCTCESICVCVCGYKTQAHITLLKKTNPVWSLTHGKLGAIGEFYEMGERVKFVSSTQKICSESTINGSHDIPHTLSIPGLPHHRILPFCYSNPF